MTTLIRPMVNEKSMGLIKSSFFTFQVSGDATKAEVAKLVKARFNVHVLSVKIINAKGKLKTQNSRKGFYTTQATKKALVQLKKGEKIALFEVASPDQEPLDSARGKEVTVRTAEGEPVAKEKRSLLGRTKVRVEKTEDKVHPTEKMHTTSGGKTKGGK